MTQDSIQSKNILDLITVKDTGAGLKAGYHQESLSWGLFMNQYIFQGADASMPLSFIVRRLEKAGFEIHSVENIGIHYSRTIQHWYHNWQSHKVQVLKEYGEWWFRCWEVNQSRKQFPIKKVISFSMTLQSAHIIYRSMRKRISR
jgi:cyclopropane fatty-acyl-phospholipid synthase-like methyltransferase